MENESIVARTDETRTPAKNFFIGNHALCIFESLGSENGKIEDNYYVKCWNCHEKMYENQKYLLIYALYWFTQNPECPGYVGRHNRDEVRMNIDCLEAEEQELVRTPLVKSLLEQYD